MAATLYAYAFLDEFVLLYPVYTLLFARTGLTPAQISSLFVVWSVTAIVLEVPSGAWADAVSRRALLCAAPLLGALGFGFWVAVPSYGAFALGFVLWGAKGALVSGALEALVYEELDALGAAGRFARLLGRAHAWGVVAVLLATLLAAPAFGLGGYAAIGIASVAAGVAGAAVALLFPEHREPLPDAGDDESGYLAALRAALAEARSSSAVRRAVILVPAVSALWGALEEYTPLLAHAVGVPDPQVPWWEAVIWAGVTAGGLAAGRAAGLSARRLAALLLAAAVTLAAGAWARRPEGLALVAIAFGALQVAGVVAQARLQAVVTGPARATVTSLASLGEDVVAIAVYLVYGALAGAAGDPGAFVVLSVPYVVVAAWVLTRVERPAPVARRRPASPGRRSGASETMRS
ncbi:MAG: MFS transporter [Kineosporiaceae bacterium]